MTLKMIMVNLTKATNKLERSNLIGLVTGDKCTWFLVGLANTQHNANRLRAKRGLVAETDGKSTFVY